MFRTMMTTCYPDRVEKQALVSFQDYHMLLLVQSAELVQFYVIIYKLVPIPGFAKIRTALEHNVGGATAEHRESVRRRGPRMPGGLFFNQFKINKHTFLNYIKRGFNCSSRVFLFTDTPYFAS